MFTRALRMSFRSNSARMPVMRRGFASTAKVGGGYFGTGHRDLDTNKHPRILVTGAVGQIGTELVKEFRDKFGGDNVVASDIKSPGDSQAMGEGPFIYLDVLSADNLSRVVLEHRIDWVIHLASMLSAVGEANPQLAMKLNTRGIENVLECAKANKLRVFAPSTIAVFGPSTPQDDTPDLTVMRPTTIYGVTKVYLELLGEYYHEKFGVDFRSVRYPGVISNAAMPGGGTTDYAVEIYHEALKKGEYHCFLKDDTKMPMMYMPDAIKAVVDLMEAPDEKLTQRCYNIHGFSFTPLQLQESIQRHLPDFKMTCTPDFRQAIADTWPRSLADLPARNDWNWDPAYTIDTMTDDMLEVLTPVYKGEQKK